MSTDNPKTATTLDEVEVLKFQNIQLRQQLLNGEQQTLNGEFQALSAAIVAKYQADGETIRLAPDGVTLVRTKIPAAEVPAPATTKASKKN